MSILDLHRSEVISNMGITIWRDDMSQDIHRNNITFKTNFPFAGI